MAETEKCAGRTMAHWALPLMALVILLLRYRYYYEPLDNDIPIRIAYAVRALAGDSYYSDLIVFGPPGALWVHELFVALVGANYTTVYIIGSVFSIITLLGVYRVTKLLVGYQGAILSALTWAVLSGDFFTQANQPNAEVFINAAFVWAFALLFNQQPRRYLVNSIAAGLLFFFASSVKHFTLVVPVVAFVANVFFALKKEQSSPIRITNKSVSAWLAAGTTVAVCWIILVVGYGFDGRLAVFADAMFGDSIRYAASNRYGFFYNFYRGVWFDYLLPSHQRPFIGLHIALLAAIVLGLRWTKDWRWRALVGWFIGTWLSVSFPGRFFPHYYMLWMPLLSIGVGCLFGLAKHIKRPKFNYGFQVALTLVLGAIIVRQVVLVAKYDTDGASRAKYGVLGEVFRETRDIGFNLIRKLPATQSVFEIGAHGLYFYAQRIPPAPFVDSLYSHSHPTKYTEIMGGVLRHSPPDILVIRRSYLAGGSNHPLAHFAHDFLRAHIYKENNDLSGKHLVVMARQG